MQRMAGSPGERHDVHFDRRGLADGSIDDRSVDELEGACPESFAQHEFGRVLAAAKSTTQRATSVPATSA